MPDGILKIHLFNEAKCALLVRTKPERGLNRGCKYD
jgi:hypothetical protein